MIDKRQAYLGALLWLGWLDFFVFNGILTFVGYLMSKPSL